MFRSALKGIRTGTKTTVPGIRFLPFWIAAKVVLVVLVVHLSVKPSLISLIEFVPFLGTDIQIFMFPSLPNMYLARQQAPETSQPSFLIPITMPQDKPRHPQSPQYLFLPPISFSSRSRFPFVKPYPLLPRTRPTIPYLLPAKPQAIPSTQHQQFLTSVGKSRPPILLFLILADEFRPWLRCESGCVDCGQLY